MEIIVNHLTRMQPGFICVAGLAKNSFESVRPVLAGERLPRGLLRDEGGPFGIAEVVNIGEGEFVGHRPEVEDRLFEPTGATRRGILPYVEFWKIIVGEAADGLRDVFGDALSRQGGGATVGVGSGEASLGMIRTSSPPHPFVDGYGALRIVLNDGVFDIRPSDLPPIVVPVVKLVPGASGLPTGRGGAV